jgi:GTP:adenosylcobinamide-phosphate guanylyltransferase
VIPPPAGTEGDRRFTVLVLAGSRGPTDPVAAAAGVPHKGLAIVAGRPMILRVLDTLRQCPEIGRVVLSVNERTLIDRLPELARRVAAGEVTVVDAARSPATSVIAALERIEDPLPLLIATADHPLLTPAMVRHFLKALGNAEAAAAVASEAVIAPAYPETRRTYIRLRGGAYSGCNLFAVVTPEADRVARFWTRVEAYRKQPWRLFAAAGPGPLLSFLFRRLDIDGVADRLSRMLGLRLRAIVLPFPEAAMDVDKPSDLALAEKILASRG